MLGPGFLGLPPTVAGIMCSPQPGKAKYPFLSHPRSLLKRWWGVLLAPRTFTDLTWWLVLCNEKSWDAGQEGRTKRTASKATNKDLHSKGALEAGSSLGTKWTILMQVAEEGKPMHRTWDSQVLQWTQTTGRVDSSRLIALWTKLPPHQSGLFLTQGLCLGHTGLRSYWSLLSLEKYGVGSGNQKDGCSAQHHGPFEPGPDLPDGPCPPASQHGPGPIRPK